MGRLANERRVAVIQIEVGLQSDRLERLPRCGSGRRVGVLGRKWSNASRTAVEVLDVVLCG